MLSIQPAGGPDDYGAKRYKVTMDRDYTALEFAQDAASISAGYSGQLDFNISGMTDQNQGDCFFSEGKISKDRFPGVRDIKVESATMVEIENQRRFKVILDKADAEKNMRECLQCGTKFIPRCKQHVYCCKECGVAYRKSHTTARKIRVFTCASCKKTVQTRDGKDKRTVFCSVACERRYWRHKHKKPNQ